MRDLRVKDLVDLATAQLPDAEDRIEKMYEWHFERGMTAVKSVLAAAATFTAALFAVLLREDSGQVDDWPKIVLGVSAVALGLVSAATYARLRFIHREYVATLQLYSELKSLVPLIRRYLGTS